MREGLDPNFQMADLTNPLFWLRTMSKPLFKNLLLSADSSVYFIDCKITYLTFVYISTHEDWVPSLWLDTFEELLYDDNELDYGDQWSLNFNYRQTDTVTKEEKKRAWKVYCHCAYGKYVLFYILKIYNFMYCNTLFQGGYKPVCHSSWLTMGYRLSFSDFFLLQLHARSYD